MRRPRSAGNATRKRDKDGSVEKWGRVIGGGKKLRVVTFTISIVNSVCVCVGHMFFEGDGVGKNLVWAVCDFCRGAEGKDYRS